MTTHEKTIRLARLIGLEHKTDGTRVTATRAVALTDGSVEWRWYPWRPYACEADLEPIKAWLARHPENWRITPQLYPTPALFCDAVLVLMPEPEPDTDDDEPAIVLVTKPEPTTAYVMGVDMAAPGTKSFSVQYEPDALAEHNDAVRNEWRERAEAQLADMQQALELMQRNSLCIFCGEMLTDTDADRDHWRTCKEHPARVEVERLQVANARATTDAETYLRIGMQRGEEIERLQTRINGATRARELAESALAGERKEVDRLQQALARCREQLDSLTKDHAVMRAEHELALCGLCDVIGDMEATVECLHEQLSACSSTCPHSRTFTFCPDGVSWARDGKTCGEMTHGATVTGCMDCGAVWARDHAE